MVAAAAFHSGAQHVAKWRWRTVAGVLVVVAATLALGWAQVAWICFLSGLVFGQLLLADDYLSFAAELAVLLYLAVALALLLVPGMHLDPATAGVYRDLAWAPLGVLFLLVAGAEALLTGMRKPLPPGSDHVSSMLFALTLGYLLLLAVVVESGTDLPLHTSMAVTLGGGILVALALTLLWNPFSRRGLGKMIARHLFPTNVPLDEWAQRMSGLAMVSEDAEQFLDKAVEELRQTSRLGKIEWKRKGGGGGVSGASGRHRAEHAIGDLEFVLWSGGRVSHIQSIVDYFRLEIITFFYASKRREVQYAAQRGSMLVHETGVRLSHDIKNILHSVKALAGLSGTMEQERLVSLVRNQLPEISRRLEGALKVIDQPQLELERERAGVSALLWWGRATRRFEHIVAEFDLDPALDESDSLLSDLYDSALENFVSNALKKKNSGDDLDISVHLRRPAKGVVELRVADTGSKIAERVANALFDGKMNSDNGSGIGLHDLHDHAARLGHEVALSENEDGRVAFTLRPAEGSGG